MRHKTPVRVAMRQNMIANQIMFGFRKRINVDESAIAEFKKRYKDAIEWVESHVPSNLSIGVAGAVGRATLFYGKDRIKHFCESLAGNFQGEYDPAHVLYMWLMGRRRYNAKEAYRRTVAAIRAFLKRKQIVRHRDGTSERSHITPAESDFFEWNETFTEMMPGKKTRWSYEDK